VSDVKGVEAILRAHLITAERSCHCGWGSDGLVFDEGEVQEHVEHVAEQVYATLRDEVQALRAEVPTLRSRVAELEHRGTSIGVGSVFGSPGPWRTAADPSGEET
jgi:hypothetical protein